METQNSIKEVKMTVRKVSLGIHEYTGLSTDTKPTGVPPGSSFLAADTLDLYITADGDNWVLAEMNVSDYITKIIKPELKAITAVAADVQSVSSTLDLSGQEKQVTILIDHAKDHASASVGQGTEYVVQVSEKV